MTACKNHLAESHNVALEKEKVMLYAAYGSNTNLEQMKRRCPKSKIVGRGKLIGWNLIFNIHADIVETDDQTELPVLLWKIHEDEWSVLDRYEGVPSYYIQKEAFVTMEDGSVERTIVYVMNDDRKGIYPPQESYFHVCETGFIENGMDTTVLYQALEYAQKNKTNYNQYHPRIQ